MAITPGPGYQVDPANPNRVIPIGSAASVNNPNYNIIAPQASAGVITKTSSAPSPASPAPTYSAPAPTYSPPPPATPPPTYSAPAPTPAPSPAPTSGPVPDVAGNQAKAAAMGITIPGVGGGTTATPPTSTPPPATPKTNTNIGSTSGDGKTFAGLVGQLGSTSAQGSGTAQAAATGAIATAKDQTAYNDAANMYKSAISELATLKSKIGAQFGAMEQGDEALPVVLGREGALNKQYAVQLEAAQEKVNGAIAAMAAATGQQNAQTQAYNTAGNIGNTAQSTAQSGLGTAAGLAQPIQMSYSNQLVNPTTGQPTAGGANSALQSAVTNAIKQIANGAGYTNAVNSSSLSSFGPAGITALQQALGPSFNVNMSDAQAQAIAQTASTGYSGSQQSYVDANTAFQTAQQQSKNVQAILSGSGINSTNSTDWNTAINSLSTRLGSANQVKYITGLNELKQAYTTLLSSVGASTPTVNGEQATAIFDPSHTPSQIEAAISALDEAAYAKLAPMYQKYLLYQGQLGTGGSMGDTGSPYHW